MVVLPVEIRSADDPLICATCGVEFPDPRIELAAATTAAPLPEPIPQQFENRSYTRGSLLKGLRDAAADRAMDAVREIGERAKFE
jgi:hypothetical protein